MIIDDKGRIFGKISVVDLFVAVVLVAVILVAYLKFGPQDYANADNDEKLVKVTFYKEAVEDFVADAVEVGDIVTNETNGTYLGEVISVEKGESISFFPNVDGKETATPMEGYSSLKITSQVMGRISDGVLSLNGNLYGNGTQIIIRAGKSKTFLNISNIEYAQ